MQLTVDAFQELHTIHDDNGITINGTYYAKTGQKAGTAVNGEINFIIGFNSNDKQRMYKHWIDGELVREMYPFIRKINGVDTCGMIDVLSGTFYQNAGSGSFTISETPAS